MDARLHEGHAVIQGNHVISNPNDGWFPALTWAMFQIDNRFQNLGRSNLSWSAKNMGDSICLRANILRQMEWAHGLTDDYELRQRLLLDGIRIFYEPRAIAYGEAAQTWSQARAQRARWLRGTRDASGKFARQLLRAGLQQRRALLLDGGLQAVFPSYSTLTLLSVLAIALQLGLNQWLGPVIPGLLIALWIALAGLLFLYPLLGLALEKAPVTAYLVTLSGPAFILWRTVLVLSARRKRKQVVWVRTAHGKRQ
jgi:cellulose synthase/poly-beta-1,6-N-acetylglucosamine synthase-like glycosyltransferase